MCEQTQLLAAISALRNLQNSRGAIDALIELAKARVVELEAASKLDRKAEFLEMAKMLGKAGADA